MCFVSLLRSAPPPLPDDWYNDPDLGAGFPGKNATAWKMLHNRTKLP